LLVRRHEDLRPRLDLQQSPDLGNISREHQ
jgi:hypothetical protein